MFSLDNINVKGKMIDEKFNFIDMYVTVSNKIQKFLVMEILEKEDIQYDKNISLGELINLIPKYEILGLKNNIKNMYSGVRSVDYSNRHLGYSIYYLPNNINKIWRVLLDLLENGLLKYKINVLDIGCGPGTIGIGIISFYEYLCEIYPNERFEINLNILDAEEEFIKIARNILYKLSETLPENLTINLKVLVKRINTRTVFNKKYDIITMSNFITLNETEEKYLNRDKFVSNLYNNLEEDGSLIIVEPASKRENRNLKILRNKTVENGKFNVYSPCNKLWDENNKFNCNCYSQYKMNIKSWELLRFLIDSDIINAKKEYVLFTYLILRKDGVRKYSCIKNKLNYSYLNEIDQENKYYNIQGIVRKKSIESNTFYICDGSIDSGVKEVVIQSTSSSLNRINMGELIALKKIKCKRVQSNIIELETDERSRIEVTY